MSNTDDLFPRVRLGLPAPDTPKAAGECATMDGMRKAIERGARDSPLIRQCLDVARHTGKSGEDTYVLLAYQALVELERAHRSRMDMLMCRPAPPMVVPLADVVTPSMHKAKKLRDAVAFLDKAKAAPEAAATRATRDAWEWVETAAREFVAELPK